MALLAERCAAVAGAHDLDAELDGAATSARPARPSLALKLLADRGGGGGSGLEHAGRWLARDVAQALPELGCRSSGGEPT